MRKSWMSTIIICFFLLFMASATDVSLDQKKLKKAEKIFKKGVKEAQKQHFDNAENLFHQALEEYPLLPGAYVELGKIEMSRNHPEKAVTHYVNARECYNKLHHLKMKVLQKNQSKSLQQSYESLGSNIPRSGGYAKQAAQETKEEKMIDDRKILQDQTEAEIPALLYLYLGGAYMRLGQLDNAERELLEGIRRDEKLAPAHFNLSLVYFTRGQYEAAVGEARIARKLGFSLPEAYVRDLEKKSNLKL